MAQAEGELGDLTFGEKVLLFRKRRGWNLLELSRETGIPESTLSRYERDLGPGPSPKRLRRLAEALKTTPDFLLGFGDNGTRV